MLFVPKKARKALKELSEQREAERNARREEFREKIMKWDKEYDEKHGL